MNKDVILTTQTKYGSFKEGVRPYLACLTLARARGRYPMMVSDGSPESVNNMFNQFGHFMRNQIQPFGLDRIEMWRDAAWIAKLAGTPIVGWLEPEKCEFLEEILTMLGPILRGEAEMVLPYRTEKSWSTYPAAQVESEKKANQRISEIMRMDLDMFFGPMFVTVDVIERFFSSYQSEHGWAWDCLHLPRLLAHADGVRIASVPTDFQYPENQRDEEVANAEAMRAKRDAQSKNIGDAYEAKARKLGMI